VLEFNVATLLRSPVGTTRQYSVDDPLNIDGIEVTVKGETQFTKTNRSILVKGEFKTEIPSTCCRCLSEFACPVKVNFEEEYFPSIDILSGLPVRTGDDDEGFTINQHHILNLCEAIRQYVIIDTPMKPLCRADCAGIPINQNINKEDGE